MPQQRFYNAADKLMNAFLMDKLKHSDACACAVGTLCGGDEKWATFESITGWDHRIRYADGYSRKETFIIEKIFEGRSETLITEWMSNPASLNMDNDTDGFIGLSRVFDYLVSIEDWSEEENKVNLIQMCLQ